MPVTLPADRRAAWLDPAARYRDLLEPDADTLEFVPMRGAVGVRASRVCKGQRSDRMTMPSPRN